VRGRGGSVAAEEFAGAISEAQSFVAAHARGSEETAIRINLMNDFPDPLHRSSLPRLYISPPSPCRRLAPPPPTPMYTIYIYALTFCDEKFNEMCPPGPAVLSYLIFDVFRYCSCCCCNGRTNWLYWQYTIVV